MNRIKTSFIECFSHRRIQHTPYYLISLLIFNMLFIVIFTIYLLYNIGFEREKNRLVELAETQSSLIDIVTQQELLLHKNISLIMSKQIAEDIILKVTNAHYQYGGFEKTGEFALGKHEDGKIQFLIKQRHYNNKSLLSVPWKSDLAEPMRLALNGKKGVVIAHDYRGVIVLAAYEPIKRLGWGIVAKMDLAEIRAPYIQAAQYALGLTIFLAVIGSIFFWYFLKPLVQDIEDSRRFNRMLINNSSTGLVLCTLSGNVIDANNSFLEIVALHKEDLENLNYFDLVADEYKEFEINQLRFLKQNDSVGPYESLYIDRNGRSVPVKISGKLLYILKIPYVWLSVDDIKEFKAREAKLLLSDTVFHNTTEVIFITDANKNIVKVNEAFTEVTGYTPEEVLGRNPKILKSGKHDSHFYEEMFKLINTTGKWHGEIWNKRKNGEIYPSLQSISAVYDKSGKLIRYVSILSDITLQKEYEEQLIKHSHHDTLTGLPNRLFFNQILQQTLSRAQRSHKVFALFFMDLNQFKEVNDTYGHDIGDELLKIVAMHLKENIRAEDFAARLGGDEFVIIFESIHQRDEAIAVAKNLIAKVKQPLLINDTEILPSISIGIAFYPEHGNETSKMLKNADKAMYYAKHHTQEYYWICTESSEDIS
ncbi:diguanylate cyclase domain-containing protein [Sulfuricurvum sp.]|uniref:diguanylate cyclase domain-containing protein n=1 Tax=Sulfuricurvum sp. TaxID=2025608 RepID=UPI002D609993|nr:diguanylate cyclase [Sulfuricurvum sp.]HZF69344.1 diguanylate cyclase [Sulfuricurvum sp.]